MRGKVNARGGESTVVVDLDGPVLDGRTRHYTCYRKILLKYGYRPLGESRYWRMKREGIGQRVLLSASGAEDIHRTFAREWRETIEKPELLMLDRVQPDAKEKLRRWRGRDVRLVLVTMRNVASRCRKQLTRLGVGSLWHHVVICRGASGAVEKAGKVKKRVGNLVAGRCVWVGDTEVDIKAARVFGCRVWAVACGLRSRSFLRSLRPDFLSSDLKSVDLRRRSCPR